MCRDGRGAARGCGAPVGRGRRVDARHQLGRGGGVQSARRGGWIAVRREPGVRRQAHAAAAGAGAGARQNRVARQGVRAKIRGLSRAGQQLRALLHVGGARACPSQRREDLNVLRPPSCFSVLLLCLSTVNNTAATAQLCLLLSAAVVESVHVSTSGRDMDSSSPIRLVMASSGSAPGSAFSLGQYLALWRGGRPVGGPKNKCTRFGDSSLWRSTSTQK